MPSIKDFINNNRQNNASQDFKQQDKSKLNNLEQEINKYKNLSQGDLMQELIKEAGRLKQNGSLNDESLHTLKSTLAPMLSNEQNQMLDSIINQIK